MDNGIFKSVQSMEGPKSGLRNPGLPVPPDRSKVWHSSEKCEGNIQESRYWFSSFFSVVPTRYEEQGPSPVWFYYLCDLPWHLILNCIFLVYEKLRWLYLTVLTVNMKCYDKFLYKYKVLLWLWDLSKHIFYFKSLLRIYLIHKISSN